MDDNANLVAWMRSRGGFVHSGLDLFAELPGGDRGVVARQRIEEGAYIMIVPVSCTMHMPTAAQVKPG